LEVRGGLWGMRNIEKKNIITKFEFEEFM
jgi:hypothetical protein